MARKKILILGATGMLGSTVTKYFTTDERMWDYDVTITHRRNSAFIRKREYPPHVNFVSFDAEFDNIQEISLRGAPDPDYVINCIGVIKPFMKSDPINARMLNAVAPWTFAKHFDGKAKMIHITTDCVFSGTRGGYNESDPHDSGDDYGQSKSLGEPDNCMVIRTSIIGEEIHKYASLVEWAKSNKGKTVKGYTNHYWNGITTKKYAEICDQIIRGDLWATGTSHVFSDKIVNKFVLLNLLSEKFNLNLDVVAHDTYPACDRSLDTENELCSKLNIGTIDQQILEM